MFAAASALIAMTVQPGIPNKRTTEWQALETNAFVHFGPNTFLGNEWGTGTEDPKVFKPARLDCDQWCRAFKSAGFKGVVITAKHHDGFCLWPSKFSAHTVAQSSYHGDVLRELSSACRKNGLKFGVYLSPWDRNHPKYGTPEYNDVFCSMLHEVLTQYGPVFEVWFDGANGEGPNGKKQVYDWPKFVAQVRQDAPSAVIFSDAGPDIRWVGNENGIAGETNWNTINRSRYYPGTPLSDELTEGDPNGTDWVPAECDVSIRPGWFWKASEDSQVKSPETLWELYMKSVGRGGSLLLNVPPNSEGVISEPDAASLREFGRLRDERFAHDLAKGGRLESDSSEAQVTLPSPAEIDMIQIREDLKHGQGISRFRVEIFSNGKWSEAQNGTTIGWKRILTITRCRAERIRVTFDSIRPAKVMQISAFDAFGK